MNSPLKQARRHRKMTLQQVANAVGIDTGNLSRIERGQQTPSKKLTEKLVAFFDREVTEVQILFPERFAEPHPSSPPATSPATDGYTGPERRTGLIEPLNSYPSVVRQTAIDDHCTDSRRE